MSSRTFGRLKYFRSANDTSNRPRARHGQWHIAAEPHVMIKIKRQFPRVRTADTGVIQIADTPEVARDLEWLLLRWPLELDPASREHLVSRADQHRASEEAVLQILSGNRLAGHARQPARAPRDYQRKSADLVHSTGRLLCTDDLGLGKTMTALLVLGAEDALPAVVVTLARPMPDQWLEELRLTWPDLTGHVVKSKQPYDPAKSRGALGEPDVLIMNYHKLAGWADHLAGRVNTIIFDECQELRHPGTDKYNSAAYVAAYAKFKIGLTNTPVYNYGGEVHSVLDVLAPGELGDREEFGREWGLEMSNGHIKVNKPTVLHSYLREQGLMLGHTRAEVGRELPPAQLIEQHVDADASEIDRLSGDAIEMAKFVLSRAGTPQERRSARGELDRRLRQATGVAKAPYVAAFTRMLLATQERVILWGWHRSVYAIWQQLLSDFRPVLFTGSESPAEKKHSIDAFAAGHSRLLMMSLRSGVGLDGIQKYCSVGVFGELDWSPMVHRQCIGRLGRDGQAAAPLIYFLLADEGSDPLVAETLNVKRMQNDLIVGNTTLAAVAQADVDDRVGRLAETVLRRGGLSSSGPKRQGPPLSVAS